MADADEKMRIVKGGQKNADIKRRMEKKSDKKNCGGSDNNKNVTNLDNHFNCVAKACFCPL